MKEDLVLGALERELAVDMNRLVLQWHCNAAQLTDFGDDKVFEFHMLKAEETFNEIGKHYLPWYSQWGNTEGSRLAALWKNFKEEEKRPEFSDWHEQVKQGMLAEVTAREAEVRQLQEARLRKELWEQEQLMRQARRRARARLR